MGGGKGGIGKTLVAVNLAIELASRGEEVVLVDADGGGANAHTALGVEPPRRTLSDALLGRVPGIRDVLAPTGLPRLSLLGGVPEVLSTAAPGLALRLAGQLRAIEAGTLVLDLGAGLHPDALDLFLAADHGVVVLVPEPASVENVYRFVKAAFWRRVRHAAAAVAGVEGALREVLGEGERRSPVDVLAALAERHPAAERVLARELSTFRPRLVVNQARTPQDAEVGQAVVAAWRKFFGLGLDELGLVPWDDELWRSARARRPLLLQSPAGPAAAGFAAIVERLEALEAGAPPGAPPGRAEGGGGR